MHGEAFVERMRNELDDRVEDETRKRERQGRMKEEKVIKGRRSTGDRVYSFL